MMSYKVLDVCCYAINYSNMCDYGISNLKLQKILYFIQAYFLTYKKDHRPCFEEKIEAWEFGPVVPKAYHEYKQYGSGDIPTIQSYIEFDEKDMWNSKRIEFDVTSITDEDKKLIDKVIDAFKDYTATDLVALTHKQSPWINAYVPYQNNEITINAIKEYFNVNVFRTTGALKTSLDQSKNFNTTKRKINGICNALSMDTQKYEPQKTIDSISAYIALTNKLDRILYSEISNYVYSLDMSKRGIFATNVEKLLLYSLNDNNKIDVDCKKMVVKIYDHFQLALHQIENVNNIFANSIEVAKENIQKQIKVVKKEYLSILGIVTTIVFAIASLYRLLLIVDFLGFVLINVLYILIKFIFTINKKDSKFLPWSN